MTFKPLLAYLFQWIVVIALVGLLKEDWFPKFQEAWRTGKKKIGRISWLAFLIFGTSVLAIWGALFMPDRETEFFLAEKGNLRFEGDAGNIVLLPKFKVAEALDMRPKDSFQSFQNDYHYEVREDGTVFIKFILNENQEANKYLGEKRGIIFSYNTTRNLFDREYIGQVFGSEKKSA